MSTNSAALVQKLWSYCKVLRDDGLTYGDYLEQLTYLLFLKMCQERTEAPFNEPSKVPKGMDWPSLLKLKGTDLEDGYAKILTGLARQPGLLGLIFRKSQNRIQNPARLRHLIVNLIDKERWTGLDTDLTGDFYEDLLERTAAEGKKGAGQYFTPRAVIKAMVECIQPQPGEIMADPACGTGGFLLAFYEWVGNAHDLDREEKLHLRDVAIRGNELVDNTARLCAMNLVLHGIGQVNSTEDPVIEVSDALVAEPSRKVDIVLANPPFGTASSMTIDAEVEEDADGNFVIKKTDEDLTISRPDFWATTSNKQLNFLQHIRSMLKIGGRAAVVLPDNVLFEGDSTTTAGGKVREMLLHECKLHTILRLPKGIFYSPGVRANVLFFGRQRGSVKTSEPATQELWVYDFRRGQHFTLKARKMTREHLQGFVDAYAPGKPLTARRPDERFKRYTIEEISARPGYNLDLWANVLDDDDESIEDLPAPEVLAEEIAEQLAGALEQFQTLAVSLKAQRALAAGEALVGGD